MTQSAPPAPSPDPSSEPSPDPSSPGVAALGASPDAEATRRPAGGLRTGWTTGACATAATRAALTALLTGDFPDPVSIRLPGGQTPAFALAHERLEPGRSDDRTAGFAEAGIIKDAGDDPDVTHGATVIARVAWLPPGSGIRFRAGRGVGTITKPGLPLDPGEPAINPVPRSMMIAEVEALMQGTDLPADLEITISIPGGEDLAARTWNPRLGIVGGLSVLGTTGIVHPFSCAAWIHSIHRGIDVARAMGLDHVLGATGSTSERTARQIYGLSDQALLDMGDFAGGLLKYLRQHPLPRLTIAGGFAKLSKLAQGALDLHSGRSQVDRGFLLSLIDPGLLTDNLKSRILSANTALEILDLTRENGIDLAAPMARQARRVALEVLRKAPVSVDVIVTSRTGEILARTE